MKAIARIYFFSFSILAVSTSLAFPPAPSYTLFGIVRDQVGQTLDVEGAALILLKGTEEVGRTPISSLRIDQNYEMKIRIDANRPSTQIYNVSAIAAGGLFNLAVEMNGSRFYPIEVSTGLLNAGKGGERVRLDLNLGADSDGDGLPDVWEQWQLYQAGHDPDENGVWDISLINRDGDFDKDGVSNWLEYIAGTFAGDATERFDLEIKEKAESYVSFEVYAITGKTYTIESRTEEDAAWKRVPLSPGETGDRAQSFTADTVGIQTIYCDPAGTGTELFRLTVR